MIIRPAEDKDRAVLTTLHLAEDVETDKTKEQIFRGGRLSSLSSGTRDVVLVAEDSDGMVRGYFWAVGLRVFDFKIGIIFDLYVDSKMRRKGAGRELLQAGIDELRKLGVHMFWAHLQKRNAPTCALLEYLGFTKQEEEVFYQLSDADAKHEWSIE
ncbi:GNAT family N-acetyltransferase [bacterium]|nr:GNAT family N-acetyltransferase [bacterium]MBU1651483.1 GNAT family N-acetyltransferase [bacterium]MBU1881369.1 GNAT family N-acetyltransferase [bacterium]